MTNLTDYIEDYLKKLLVLSSKNYIEIQRRELAGKFKCVPSQINYVLKSRFSRELGYIVEGRRGGGGYIRIYRLDPGKIESWLDIIGNCEDYEFETEKIGMILKRMREDNLISMREVRLIKVLVDKKIYESCELDSFRIKTLQRKLFLKVLEEIFKTVY